MVEAIWLQFFLKGAFYSFYHENELNVNFNYILSTQRIKLGKNNVSGLLKFLQDLNI